MASGLFVIPNYVFFSKAAGERSIEVMVFWRDELSLSESEKTMSSSIPSSF